MNEALANRAAEEAARSNNELNSSASITGTAGKTQSPYMMYALAAVPAVIGVGILLYLITSGLGENHEVDDLAVADRNREIYEPPPRSTAQSPPNSVYRGATSRRNDQSRPYNRDNHRRPTNAAVEKEFEKMEGLGNVLGAALQYSQEPRPKPRSHYNARELADLIIHNVRNDVHVESQVPSHHKLRPIIIDGQLTNRAQLKVQGEARNQWKRDRRADLGIILPPYTTKQTLEKLQALDDAQKNEAAVQLLEFADEDEFTQKYVHYRGISTIREADPRETAEAWALAVSAISHEPRVWIESEFWSRRSIEAILPVQKLQSVDPEKYDQMKIARLRLQGVDNDVRALGALTLRNLPIEDEHREEVAAALESYIFQSPPPPLERRKIAVEMLLNWYRESTADAVRPFLHDEKLREDAHAILCKMGDEQIISELLDEFQHASRSRREEMLNNLALAGSAIEDRLIAMLPKPPSEGGKRKMIRGDTIIVHLLNKIGTSKSTAAVERLREEMTGVPKLQ